MKYLFYSLKGLVFFILLAHIAEINAQDENTNQPDTNKIKGTKSSSGNAKKHASAIQETVLGMNVSGNKEAPNLLYIIPWKDSGETAAPPEITRLMDEVFSTVDPDVFEKEVGFYNQLTQDNKPQLENKP